MALSLTAQAAKCRSFESGLRQYLRLSEAIDKLREKILGDLRPVATVPRPGMVRHSQNLESPTGQFDVRGGLKTGYARAGKERAVVTDPSACDQ